MIKLCFAIDTWVQGHKLSTPSQGQLEHLQCYYTTSTTTLEPILLFLVFDGKFTARCALVLAANKVRDGLVLGLFRRRLIALITLAENLFLHKVNG